MATWDGANATPSVTTRLSEASINVYDGAVTIRACAIHSGATRTRPAATSSTNGVALTSTTSRPSNADGGPSKNSRQPSQLGFTAITIVRRTSVTTARTPRESTPVNGEGTGRCVGLSKEYSPNASQVEAPSNASTPRP